MQDIIQINATWGIDLNALRGILIVGKSLSKRELFTKHGVMIKDGKPYTGDKNGNIGGNTQENFMKWLKQCADYTTPSDKILIHNVINVSSITHTTNKPLYKPYIESLFYDFINREYETSFINIPSQYMTMRVNYSMINDYITQHFNILGDMYNLFTVSYYDDKLKEYFYNNYDINYPPFYSYVMKCLRNSMIHNIDNTINSISVLGMDKNLIYSISGSPLTAGQEQFITDNYVKPIRYNDKVNGKNYTFNLTGEINKQLKDDFNDNTKIKTLSKILQIDEFSPISEIWDMKIDKKYKMIQPKLDIDFCRRKLNENAIQKILKTSGYDTILKYYNIESMDFIIPSDLKKYLLQNMMFSDKRYLKQYLNDLDTIIKDIA